MKFIIFLFVKYSTRTFHPNLLIYSLKKPSPVWGKIGPLGQFSLQTSFLPTKSRKKLRVDRKSREKLRVNTKSQEKLK